MMCSNEYEITRLLLHKLNSALTGWIDELEAVSHVTGSTGRIAGADGHSAPQG